MPALAAAYSGPPKFTLVRAFTEWRVDVPMLVLILLVGAWYLWSARKVRRGGGQWGSGRTFAFIVLGLGFWAVAMLAWPGVYESVLFYARATQTVLLVLVAPLFLAMGKPLTLLIEAYPGIGGRVERAVRSRAAQVVTFPAITTLLLVAVPMSMYFTTWYTHVFTSGAVRELTYLVLMAPGYVFFWTLLRVDPVPQGVPVRRGDVDHRRRGGRRRVLRHRGHRRPDDPRPPRTTTRSATPSAPAWPPARCIGGGIIWILGDFVGLPFLAVQLIQMMRADKREAEEIDAELDARDAARAGGDQRNQRVATATPPKACRGAAAEAE